MTTIQESLSMPTGCLTWSNCEAALNEFHALSAGQGIGSSKKTFLSGFLQLLARCSQGETVRAQELISELPPELLIVGSMHDD